MLEFLYNLRGKKVHFFDRPYPFRIYDGGRHEKNQ